MSLMAETNTRTMERKVRQSFRASIHYSVCCIQSFDTTFEHGQWWIIANYKEGHGDEEQRTFSVVDTNHGLDFEQV